MPRDLWLDPPPKGTSVCGGFDGSENDDWTALKLETRDGYIFTPRYGPDRDPAIWNPAKWGGRIPRHQVALAWEEIADTYQLRRVYCDPGFHDESSWESDIEGWDLEHGPDVFVQWPTNKDERMYAAIRRFEADLRPSAPGQPPPLITHDGCPITTTHIGNARKIARGRDRYSLAKPTRTQKIDVAVTTVLAHEAASDERAAGWLDPVDTTVHVFRRTGGRGSRLGAHRR